MNARIIIVPENLKEENLKEYLIKQDAKIIVIKIKKSTMHDIRNAICAMEDYRDRWAYYQEAITRIMIMDNLGKPDFFISNGKTFLLAEFKSSGDNISKEQIIWFEKNKDLPLAIIIAYNFTTGIKDKLPVLQSNLITEEEKNNEVEF